MSDNRILINIKAFFNNKIIKILLCVIVVLSIVLIILSSIENNYISKLYGSSGTEGSASTTESLATFSSAEEIQDQDKDLVNSFYNSCYEYLSKVREDGSDFNIVDQRVFFLRDNNTLVGIFATQPNNSYHSNLYYYIFKSDDTISIDKTSIGSTLYDSDNEYIESNDQWKDDGFVNMETIIDDINRKNGNNMQEIDLSKAGVELEY